MRGLGFDSKSTSGPPPLRSLTEQPETVASPNEVGLDGLSERAAAFRSARGRRSHAACLASSDGFLAALPQPALERVPSSPDANCAVTDNDRIRAGGHDSRAG